MAYHDFVLLPEGEAGARIYADMWDYTPETFDSAPGYRRWLRENQGIRVPDSLICYMWDSLEWVWSEDPYQETTKRAAPWRGHGLDYHGETAIRRRGARVLRHVCESWATLFSQAPRNFTVRGAWRYDEKQYEVITFHRREVVPLLRRLAGHAERACTGEWLIIHIGL